ncbi:kelch-like protein 11 [Eucyclogobius newberryi]|uniref:kelch-like protein 11 n=1 Tax=Eucyclogobius newberryi TaxID=166745 RepID=UPI003B5C15C3
MDEFSRHYYSECAELSHKSLPVQAMAAAADGDPVDSICVGVEEGETVGDEAEEFSCCPHCSKLAQRQNEQRKAGQFCDLTLLFTSGARVHTVSAHRSVLSAASYYFTALLSGQGAAPSGSVELRDWGSVGPEPGTVEAVIEFMYTGQIRVTAANAHQVLELAHRFLLANLKSFCGEFLRKRLTLKNCVSVHRLALTYTLDQLNEGATALIRKHFHKVIHNKDFHALPFDLIRRWLSDSEITVNNEQELFEVIVEWVYDNQEEREEHFDELFRLLRLTQISPAYLSQVVTKESLVANNSSCRQLVSEAIEVHAISLENLTFSDISLYASYIMKLKPRFCQKMDVILVVGGVSESGDHLSESIGYFVAEDRWVNLPHIHNHHDGHAIAVTDHYVYIAGSMEPGFAKAVERYDLYNNNWEPLCALTTRKHSFGLACVKEVLYSVGGHGNFSPGFKDVDVYNSEQDQWYSLESAPQILRDVKTLVIEGRYIYMMARTPIDIEEDDGLRTVAICFDTETSRWQEVASLPLLDNYCTFQMALACSNFYNTASFCPKNYDESNEVAQQKMSTSVPEDILDSLPPEVLTLEGASVCYLGNDIFVIGGWKGSNSMDKQCRKEAYRYCAERKRWMLLPPMPQSRCRGTACHIRVPFKYLQGNQHYPMPHNFTRHRDRFQHLQYRHRRTLTLRRQLQAQIEC